MANYNPAKEVSYAAGILFQIYENREEIIDSFRPIVDSAAEKLESTAEEVENAVSSAKDSFVKSPVGQALKSALSGTAFAAPAPFILGALKGAEGIIDVRGTKHEHLSNVSKIKEGDLISIDVRDPRQFAWRVNVSDYPHAEEILSEAKRIGAKSKELGIDANWEIANKVFAIVDYNFVIYEGKDGATNYHNIQHQKTVLLQMAFQEAGIPSRLVMGNRRGSSKTYDVWVEIDSTGKGSYDYYFSPHAWDVQSGKMEIFKEKGNIDRIAPNKRNAVNYVKDSKNFNSIFRSISEHASKVGGTFSNGSIKYIKSLFPESYPSEGFVLHRGESVRVKNPKGWEELRPVEPKATTKVAEAASAGKAKIAKAKAKAPGKKVK